MVRELLTADEASDADEGVITLLANKNKAVVISPKANQKVAGSYDRDLYKVQYLIENLLQSSSSYVPSLPDTRELAETYS
jgi:hypothetical protein